MSTPSTPNFSGLRVLLLESRRAREMASIVTSYRGEPIIAPSMREVPLESNEEAIAFADALVAGEYDVVILLTGVGTRALVEVVERVRGSRDAFVSALTRVTVIARGPKPVAVLRELKVPIWLVAPEPNTWRELLAAVDAKRDELSLAGKRVAVQEYGEANTELLSGLAERGAQVTRVPVYRWALPEDLEPLRAGIRACTRGDVDVVMFTTGTQVAHLLQVAADMRLDADVRAALRKTVVASIGPTTSEALALEQIAVDIEPSHPKMGFLVREAAERAAGVLAGKRSA
jgi:uroporphyrinogen-III synthase